MLSDAKALFDELSQKLLKQGITEEQLKAVVFTHLDTSLPFSSWAFSYPIEIEKEALCFATDYLALRWVLQDAGSRPISGASEHIQGLLLVESLKNDQAFKERQSAKGQRRRRLTDDGKSPSHLVFEFSRKPENADRTITEKWNHFFHFLTDNDLEPEVHADKLSYRTRTGRAKLVFRTFANMISNARKKSSTN